MKAKHFSRVSVPGSSWEVMGSTFLWLLPVLVWAQPDPAWKVHDWRRPRPRVVDPGTSAGLDRPGRPPSDAVVLFEGTDLRAWCSLDGSPPGWVVKQGAMECVQGSGYIRTLQNFGNCQLHLEWAAPMPPRGQSQGRGNSGVFFMGLYEVQILDSWENRTYADGQAAAIYGQYPPLVNAARPPGQWQAYDIVFDAPRFDERGELMAPAWLTVFHNGVLVQNHMKLTGPTGWMQRAPYQAHPPKLPLSLQDHGNPVRFRNIWVRELSDADSPEFTYATSLLDRYVGRYRVDDDFLIEVTRSENHLQMRLIHPDRTHAYPLSAASPVKFFARSVDAHLVFHTNSVGVAEGLTFHIAGEDRPAKKVASVKAEGR